MFSRKSAHVRQAMKTTWVNLTTFLLLLTMSSGAHAFLVTNSPDLPPEGGVYVSVFDFSYHDPGLFPILGTDTITISGPRLYPTQIIDRIPDGHDEIVYFESRLEAFESGFGFPVLLTGPIVTRTTDRNLSTTGLFDTEILEMNLFGDIGGMPIEIRLDQNQPSLGQTFIADIGGGLYHIDSFFDVFTELSIDGGSTWIPSMEPVSMELTAVPLPPAVALLASGLLGLMGFSKRKRSI